MNTEELIVMGVLMILAGGLMVARHFVHTMEIPAPMATRKVDIGNTEEDLPINAAIEGTMTMTGTIDLINAAIREALDIGDKQMATLKQRIFAQDRRIAELEQRTLRMVQNYEGLIATFKERDEAMEQRVLDLEGAVIWSGR